MRKAVFHVMFLLLLMFCSMQAFGQNTQLSGQLQTPNGIGFNGQLQLQLQVPASASSTCSGGPAEIVPNEQVIVTITDGAMVSAPKIWGADCLTPACLPYTVRIVDNQGNVAVNDQWIIGGDTFDIGTAQSASVAGCTSGGGGGGGGGGGTGSGTVGNGTPPEIPYYSAQNTIQGDPYFEDEAATSSGAEGLIYTGNGALFATNLGGGFQVSANGDGTAGSQADVMFSSNTSAGGSGNSVFQVSMEDSGASDTGSGVINLEAIGAATGSGDISLAATNSNAIGGPDGSILGTATGTIEFDAIGPFSFDASNAQLDSSGNLTVASCTGCGGGSGGVPTVNSNPGALQINFSSGAGSCTYSGGTTTCSITGSGTGGGSVTDFIANTSDWPTWLVPTVVDDTTTPTLKVAASAIPNSALDNDSITINSTSCVLGGSCTISSSGSGTVNSGTAGDFAYYATSGTAVSADGNLTDATGILLYTGTGGMEAASFTSTSSTTGYQSWVAGSGTEPSLPSDSAGFMGPVASGTPYLIQLPATIAAGTLRVENGATVDGVNVSQLTTSAPQTTVSCSSVGSVVFSQPDESAAYKSVIVYESSCSGTASYTYATAFSHTPQVLSQSLASTATSVSTTAVTITGSSSTGFVLLNGY